MRKGTRLKLKKRLADVLIENLRSGIPSKRADIIKTLGITPKMYDKWKQHLVEAGLFNIEIPDTPQFLVTFEKFSELDKIKLLEERIKLEGGSVGQTIHNIYHLCFVLKISPDKLLDNTRQAQLYFVDYLERCKKLKITHSIHEIRKALRKSLRLFDQPVTGGRLFMVNLPTADYSRVQLSDKEREFAMDYIEKIGNYEFKVIFAIHHEIFPRTHTLFQIKYNQYKEKTVTVDNKSLEYLELPVYESKQKKTYDKLILDPTVVKMVKELNGRPIFKGIRWDYSASAYKSILRRLYMELGKTTKDPAYGSDEWFYYNRPTYVIRHSSAHMWMRRTGFNASLVSTMGWEEASTLTTHYANIGTANLMQQGTCFFCRPPIDMTGDAIFCSPTHALAYLTKQQMNKTTTAIIPIEVPMIGN